MSVHAVVEVSLRNFAAVLILGTMILPGLLIAVGNAACGVMDELANGMKTWILVAFPEDAHAIMEIEHQNTTMEGHEQEDELTELHKHMVKLQTAVSDPSSEIA